MTEKPECTSVHEDFEGIFDEGLRPRSRCAEVLVVHYTDESARAHTKQVSVHTYTRISISA
jgi:hypothetical protein